MSVELKIKSKHLSEEARIIRFEERKIAKQLSYLSRKQGNTLELEDNWHQTPYGGAKRNLNNIHSHRTQDVRNENRATFLARGFIAGKLYREIENKTIDELKLKHIILKRTLAMVQKYHDHKVKMEDLLAWISPPIV